MNQITLTRAEFDALPKRRLPPEPARIGLRWKLESGGKWWLAGYVDGGGFVEIRILEIVIEGDEVARLPSDRRKVHEGRGQSEAGE